MAIYVLYVVTIHTESVIYSRQWYFKISSDFFDPQCSLMTVSQSQTCMHKLRESRDYLHVTFDPRTSVREASCASSLACNKLEF